MTDKVWWVYLERDQGPDPITGPSSRGVGSLNTAAEIPLLLPSAIADKKSASALIKLISKIEEHGHKAKSKEYYQKMLEAHPSLTKEDPSVVAKYWAS